MTTTELEKVSQESMLSQFKERYQKCIAENQQLAQKIKENGRYLHTIRASHHKRKK